MPRAPHNATQSPIDRSRVNLAILERILGALERAGTSLRPTQLQCAAHMNYTQFARYLELLTDRHIVAVECPATDRRLITLTAEGEDACRSIASLYVSILGEPPSDRPARRETAGPRLPPDARGGRPVRPPPPRFDPEAPPHPL